MTPSTLSSRRHPLIGREYERELLHTCLAHAVAGRGSLVLISGEAGIGKTALVDSLIHEVNPCDCLVLTGSCYDLMTTPPYGLWIEATRTPQPAQDHSDLTGWPDGPGELDDSWRSISDLLDNSDAIARLGSQDALFAATRDFFRELAVHRPLVLVLDDLHWADQASLDFLRYFSRQLANIPILVIAIYRTDELHRQHPLSSYLPLLVRETKATRIVLRPLTAAEHRALIRQRYRLDAGDQRSLVDYLVERGEGNPLFAEELLRTLEHEGLLVQDHDLWSLGDLDQVRVPPLLLQVIESRLSRLDEATRQLLQVAAIIGQEVPIELWQHVGAVSDETLGRAVEKGMAAHLLVEASAGSIRFRHGLFREALYDGTVVVRRRLLHRQIAEESEKAPAPDPDRVAYHYEQAADQRAAEWWLRAAWRARRSYAWRAAAERLEAVIRCQEQLGVRIVPQQLLLLMAAISIRFANPETAVNRLTTVIMEAERVDDQAVAAVALAERGYIMALLGHIQEGTAEIERALRMCDRLETVDPGVFERADSKLSSFGPLGPWGLQNPIASRRSIVVFYWALAGRLADVLDTSTPLHDALLRADENNVLPEMIKTKPDAPFGAAYHIGNSAFGLGILYALMGRVDDAERFFRLAYRTYQAHTNPFVVNLSAWIELIALVLPLQSEHIDRRRHLQVLIQNSARQSENIGPPTLSSLAPDFAVPLIEGDWNVARERAGALRQAYRIGMSRRIADSVLAEIERRQGNIDAALAVVMETFPSGPKTEPGNFEFVICQSLQRIAANIALDRGDMEESRAWLEAHDRWLAWAGAVLGRADGALLWAHFHRRESDLALARERAEEALVRATNPRQALVLISIHRFLGELDTDEQRFVEADEHLQHSLALADACLASFERALSLVALAELRIAQQREVEAVAFLAEARSICHPLGATPTLERVTLLESGLGEDPATKRKPYPAGLTDRQVEVLKLVAEGLTDTEAADRLFISRRTVSQHLRRIYKKIGVNSRTAATRFAVENHLI